ncbi:MAG: hypothetical protein U1E65_24230 [Myxococcota bacterium]
MSAKPERPYLLAALSIVLGLLVSVGAVWASTRRPEPFLIGMNGHHDARGGFERKAACLDCHVPFVGTPASRCLSPGCHGELATGSPPKIGPAMPVRFHAALREEPCGPCHDEHIKGDIEQQPRRTFSHDLVPPSLRAECRRCHSGSMTASHSRTDSVECSRCHEMKAWRGTPIDHSKVTDEHCDVCHVAPEGAVHATIAGTCSTCHETSAWKPAKSSP